ncbi:ParB N-terminal domain-containing protein [Undibacterium sp. RTI2.1]|uniref:ParB/Srx family N-terminal domain-containing protein n=1 Tax=unclassified Undibacterium TaxID=2630295 RepID=UPI002AB4B9B6|nr:MULTISPECIES: ParB N-terminal domain-containing protein [unclassified Undibacterium]MDY7537596.1 ParB N-terminal domain-containing protein [Undibacterium sp. 5I1]MEB0029196.1 ParB N-terminal domain-containing protein [Undibacterium sp. RTI2.1]MEB0115504.1 ParB N-terminal domain-containing protein [Undibacterium sp. RTI2.2]MEB0230140.1 ParB N-terminal domain-containing protein [Undibacterium sp. 10I3]MEB0256332.1 ParB N-terminal domain-containing protein [Undibacterium sp. 5I1]
MENQVTVKPRIEIWDISRVIPYELNAKIHDLVQIKRIAKSIKDFGFDQPIVVDKNGVIIKGHGRRGGAEYLGMKQVPVWIRDDLTDDQVRASRLADNRVAISNLDTDILQKELASLNFDLVGIFDAKELDFVIADLGEIDTSAFVNDLDGAIQDQADETAKTLEESTQRAVRIDKALGFKTINGKDERAVAMFMAQLETESGLPADKAFVEFVRSFDQKTTS